MKLLDRAFRPYPTRADRPLVWAHRGASALAPENTIEAFALAATEGADGVELDAMVCGSGEVVVCHDVWLDRLAGRQLCVHATALAALQLVDVAKHQGAWGRPARIPTLAEVLEAVPSLRVNIELKEDRLDDAGLAQKVAAIVRDRRAEERVVISSFNPLELLRLRAHAPRLPLAFLFEGSGPGWLSAGVPAPLLLAQAVHGEEALLSPLRIRRWKRAGFRVAAWTVDDPARARALAALGVDGIFTNHPRRTIEALR